MSADLSGIRELRGLLRAEDVQAAKELLIQALEEDPQDITVSCAIQQFEQFDMCNEVLTWLQEAEIGTWQYELALALLNIKSANVQEGLNALEAIRETTQLCGRTCQITASFLAEGGHFSQASRYQMLSLEDKPVALSCRLRLGAYHWLAGEREQATVVFRETFEQIQKDKAGFFDIPSLRQKTLLGESLADMLSKAEDDPAEVRAELGELINAYSDSNILFDRAVLSARLDDWDSAVKYIDLAFDKTPKESGIETARAIIYYHTGALQEALTFLQSNLSRVKGTPVNWVRLGFIHQELGSTEEAFSALHESFLIKKDLIVLLCIACLSRDSSEEIYDSISALALNREIPKLALDIPRYVLPQESIEEPETPIERSQVEKPRKPASLEELSEQVLDHPTYGRLGHFLFEVRRRKAWEKALPVAQALVEEHPGGPQNHFLLADVFHHLGKEQEAEEQIRAALAVAAMEKGKQANVYFQAGATFYPQWGKVDQAVNALRKSYELEPKPDTALNLALNVRRQAEEEDSVRKAIKVLEVARKKFPNHEGILFHLARLYGDSQDHEKAEAVYDELLSFTSEPVKVYRDRGLMYKSDNPQEAIKAFEQAILLDDTVDQALYNLLIDTYSSNGEIERALSLADEFISVKGAEHGVGLDMCLRKGNIYRRFGKIPEAIAVLRTVSRRGNKTQRYYALMSLGEIYLDDKRDLKRAQEVLEEASDTGLDETASHLLLQVYEGLEDFERALDLLRKLRDRRPRDIAVLGNLGTVFMKAGEVSEAIMVLTEALELQPDDVSLSFGLIEAYVRKGQIASAESLLRKVDEAGLNMAQRQRLAEIHRILASRYEEDTVDFQKYTCVSLIHQAASVRNDTQHLGLLRDAKEYADRLEEYAQRASHLTEDELDEYRRLRYCVDALIESHLANRSEPWTDEHRKHLEQAKNSYYGAGREAEGRKYEFLLRYAEAQGAIQRGDYDQADRFFQKAISLRQRLDAPGIIYTQESLEVEQKQLRALKEIAEHNFEAASRHYEECLDFLEAGSREHLILQMSHLYTRCLATSPEDTSRFDSYADTLRQALGRVTEEGLGPNLAALMSLTYSYMALESNPLFVQEPRNRNFLDKQIVPRIVEIATGLQLKTEQKRRQQSQVEIVRHPWLQRLPRQIYDRLEDQRYRLDWAKTDDEKAAALAKIYTYLDGCTAIVVEESARILYRDNWEEEFYALGPEFHKPFQQWPWGSRARALSSLNDLHEEKLAWMDLPPDFLKRLGEHIHIRNTELGYAHAAEATLDFTQLCSEAYSLFEELVDCFPVFFKVIAEEVKRIEEHLYPFYDVEMLWYYPLKKCPLRTPNLESALKVGKVYCLPPNSIVKEGQLLQPRAGDVLENRSFETLFLLVET